jgi:hypothetical protein
LKIFALPSVSKTALADALLGQGNFDVAGPLGQVACRGDMEIYAKIPFIFKGLFRDPQMSPAIQDGGFRRLGSIEIEEQPQGQNDDGACGPDQR